LSLRDASSRLSGTLAFVEQPVLSSSAWRELAAALELEFESAGSYLYGDREGHRVVCHATRGAEWTVHEIAIVFRRPFDIVNGVLTEFHPETLESAAARATHSPTRAALARAKALVGSPPPPALVRLGAWGAEVFVRDDRLLVARRADGASPRMLAEILAEAVAFVVALEARRDLVPVRPELARMDGPFRATASELSIVFTPCPMGLAGTIENVVVSAGAAERDGDWRLVLAAEFPAKPPLEVNIGPHVKTLAERFFLSSPTDDELGDRALDDALEVATDSPDELRRRLSSVHASLRALVDAGELTIAQNVSLVARAPTAPFGELLRHVAAIAAALSETRNQRGPFR
jgi:hypothetical protein